MNVLFASPSKYDCIEMANEALIHLVDEHHPSLFITVYNEETLYVDTLTTIKQKGIPTLLICHDNLLIPFHHKNICKHFDLVWLTSRENSELFYRWGARTIIMPYAANPYFFIYHQGIIESFVVFVGNPYGSRSKEINDIIRTGVETRLYFDEQKGKASSTANYGMQPLKTFFDYMSFPIGRKVVFARVVRSLTKEQQLCINQSNVEKGMPLSFEDMCKVYSRSALVYSSTSARSTGLLKKPVPVINLRSFEVPMCGGVQICRYNQELSEYFEEDKEVLFFRDDDELRDKSLFYVSERATGTLLNMKMAARRRAEREHTWTIRFKSVFEELGIGTW